MEENKGLFKSLLKTFSRQDGLDDLLAMSEHWNGHKRENAVRRLGMLGNPIAIPKLIVRANDWVSQVRKAANESLNKLLINKNAETFVLSLPDLFHLKNCGRDDHEKLIVNIINFLLKSDNVCYIKSAIRSENPYLARIAVKLCIENSLINKQELVSEILSHDDIVVRKIASNFLCDFSGDVLEIFLQKAIQDPFMPIRREAFQIYLRVLPEKGLKISRKFLYDRHVSIREIAITHLIKNNINVEEILTNVLLSANQSVLKLRCAILGLANIGSKQSIPLITTFVSYSLPNIKKATLQSLVKLNGEESLPYLIDGLKDKSPGVSKESSRLINKLKINLSADVLIDIVEKINHPHTLSVCISSARKINKWHRLIFLLTIFRFLILKDSVKAKLVDYELTKWDADFNRSSSQPSKTQIEQIASEFNNCKELFSKERVKFLEFTIKGFGVNI